jgi:hypothetical protein
LAFSFFSLEIKTAFAAFLRCRELIDSTVSVDPSIIVVEKMSLSVVSISLSFSLGMATGFQKEYSQNFVGRHINSDKPP